jgi:hypothetical protein
MYVHTSGMALRLMPPPSSEILIVMSSVPSTMTSLIGGREDGSVSGPKRSTTARREFLSSSKRMCDLHGGAGRQYVSGVKGVIQSVQMTGNVGECQVLRADQLHRRTFEHPIVLLTHEPCILNRLCRDIMHVSLRTNNPYIVGMRLEGVERDICSPCQCNPPTQTW